jgi:signal transduction histidine kinase/ActR/RegA family two-component response regulator
MESVSIQEHAEIANTKTADFSIEEIINQKNNIRFSPLSNTGENIGFTTANYWIKFQIKNDTDEQLNYFLETARPIIDSLTLYSIGNEGKVNVQENGDAIAFEDKSVPHRKSIFKITILPTETYTVYLNIKNDGEALVVPIRLHSNQTLLQETYAEQIFYGLFYGILLLAFVVYLFFYFGLKAKVFLWYTLYILFVGLLQFALDGFFHQYFTPNAGWLNNRAVLLIAALSLIFFLKYTEHFLEISKVSKHLTKIYKCTTVVLLALIFGLNVSPEFLPFAYPMANFIGLLVLISVVGSIIFKIIKKQKVDIFFIGGISFLVLGFVVFILNNIGVLPHSFFAENGPKFGTGLEIIFLSISMSNRIKSLRKENELNQRVALQRSRDMNDIKSYFLSNLSHELRTPLNLIMGVASSIESETSETNLKEQAELITASSKSLLSSINDIVDFTDIEKGNYTLNEAPFNLHELLLKVHNTIAPLAKEKNLNFEQLDLEKLPKEIIGDEKKLTQVLTNLLDNAVKFTPAGEIALRVKVSNFQKTKTRLNFYIRDTGIGISEDKVSTAFESFTKHSFDDKREFDGLGLGLYIAKTCVDLQMGNIDLRKNSDGGTTCKIQLDFEVVPQAAVQQPVLEDCKILLVEDNKMNQTVIKLFMKKYPGVKLTIANNGQEGLEHLKADKFDIVLMDLQMPIMDGFEAIEKIRKNSIPSISNSIPIIVLTADCTGESYARVQKLGVNDFMTKPILEKLLLQKIKTVMDTRLQMAS